MTQTKLKPLYLAKSLSDLENKCSLEASVDLLKVDERNIFTLFKEAAELQNSDEEKAFIFFQRTLILFDVLKARTAVCVSDELKRFHEMAKDSSRKLRENLCMRYELEQKIRLLDDLIVCNDPISKNQFENKRISKEAKHFPGHWMPPIYLYDMIANEKKIFLIDMRPKEQYIRKKICKVPQIHFGCQIFHGQTVTALEKRMNTAQLNQWNLHRSADMIILFDEHCGSELIERPDEAENFLLSRRHPLKNMYDALVTYNADKMSLPPTVFLSGGFLEFEKRYPSLISVTPIYLHSSATLKPSDQIGYPSVVDNNECVPLNDLHGDDNDYLESENATSDSESLPYCELIRKLKDNGASAEASCLEPLRITTSSKPQNPTVDRSTKPQRNASPTLRSYPKFKNEMEAKPSVPDVNRSTKPQIPVKIVNRTDITDSSSKSDKLVASLRTLRRGLMNMGNTCYMNSSLQCLLHTPDLWNFFMTSNLFRGKLSHSFANFVIEMSSPLQSTAYLPKNLKESFDKSHPVFAGGQQQDSHEFLMVFLDSLHEELNRSEKKMPFDCVAKSEDISAGQVADLSWRKNRTRDNSVILDWFNGQLQSKVQCLTCGKCSYAFDEFMYLSVSIQGSASTNLMKCIEQFFESEKLSGGSRWLCPQCKSPSEAVKTFCVCRFPKYLIIHLKRFHCYRACQKIESYVQFPLTGLDVSTFAKTTTAPDYKYDLYGVINHHGSVDSGHYTASCFDSTARKWWNFDDSRVTELLDAEVQTRAVYVLFYKRSQAADN